jgi:hypothetical protein
VGVSDTRAGVVMPDSDAFPGKRRACRWRQGMWRRSSPDLPLGLAMVNQINPRIALTSVSEPGLRGGILLNAPAGGCA